MEIFLSAALMFEYEAAIKRPGVGRGLNAGDKDAILDYLSLVAIKQDIRFLWRPWLKDPDDDMVLELAVAAGAPYIVTHNLKDFAGVERLKVRAVSPAKMLDLLRGKS